MEKIELIIAQIVNKTHPLKIVLFGSRARGDHGDDSDIDICVLVPNGTNRRRTAQMLYREIDTNGVSFDIIVATLDDLQRYRDNPGLIYASIIRDGVEVYAA